MISSGGITDWFTRLEAAGLVRDLGAFACPVEVIGTTDRNAQRDRHKMSDFS
jgi:hypothetical protein